MLEWSPEDQLAAVTSLSNELEACPGCGLRPDQHHTVEADLQRCPGCEARARVSKDVKADDAGLLVGFFPVADTRLSLWASFTEDGMRWRAQHRDAPDGLIYQPGGDG